MFSGLLQELVNNLTILPGIGKKSAQRMAIHIISMEKDKAFKIAENIEKAVKNYKPCSICNMLSETDPCDFCKNEKRDNNLLCIVENTQDVYLINKTGEFRGLFFVLGNLLSPIDGIGPQEINFTKLTENIKKNDINEIILALNPSAEGESTMNFLVDRLKKQVNKITRLSTGLPFGGDIEYSTEMTLLNAIRRRYEID